MAAAMSRDAGSNDVLRPRAPAGMGRGALLSLFVHSLLVLALAASLVWRSQTPATFEAELWAATPQQAAPPPPPPAPPVVAPPAPPTPVPKPEPRPQPPTPPAPEADIAIEKARKAAAAAAEQQRLARIEREKAERLKAEREQAEREKLAREKLEREKIAAEKAAREKAQREAQAKEEARQRELKQAQQEKAEEERLAKLREDNLKRLRGQTGATGATNATGSAAQDAAPSAGYAGKLVARIRPNILLTDEIRGKPAAVVEVRAAAGGTILSRRLVKSSGNPDWDDAVLRAIDRTGELPRDIDGRVPPVIAITFTPE